MDGKTAEFGASLHPSQIDFPVTHMNDALLSQIDMQPLESFRFKGANDEEVHGFIVKPPGFDPTKKYPLKFLIHGGPQGAWGNEWSYRWNPELFAANGYVVMMINFHGSTGYGQKFTDSISGDWGGKPYVDLMKGLDYVEKTYPFIDKNREAALGASYGGYMANWLLGHTDRFKCIVSHDGMFNTESAWGTTEELWFPEWEFKGPPWKQRELYRKFSPHLFADKFKTPTLVVHGQNDYRLDVSEGFQLFTTLQRLKVPSKMLYFPDEGHWVLKPQNSRLWYKTVNDWVDQWCGESRLPACLGHRSILLADLLRKQAGSLSAEVRAGLANGKMPDFPRQSAVAQTLSASLVVRCGLGVKKQSPLAAPSSKRVSAMGATAADGAFATSDDLRFKQHCVNVRKVLQLQPRNFLSNEMLNRLQRGQLLAVHQGESVADVLGATSPSNAMDIILRMLRHIIIDDVTDAGNIESARGDIGRDHHLVFSALESFERLDPFALGAIRMQHCD